MKQFILTLGRGFTIDVVFDILNTDIAQRWATEVSNGYPLYEINRFKGWPIAGRDFAYYVDQLTTQVNTVNEYRPNTIDNSRPPNQETLNYLHKFFEDLRGPIEVGTEFYNTAPINVQQAIDRFNVVIHEFEHFLRHGNCPELVGTYRDRPRFDLQPADYDLFTFKWEFGCVYINYCEVGKPLIDVFKDQDTYVGDTNIRPLQYYSADFTVKFGPSIQTDYYEARKAKIYEWIDTLPMKFEHLSLGQIPVAKLNVIDSGFEGMTEAEIVEHMSAYLQIAATCIK
jgi:hypothetical protein